MSSILLAPDDPRYPAMLADLARVEADGAVRPPPSIYVRGLIPGGPAIAVVGTRDATDEARDFTRKLVRELVDKGFCIWSGGALGIDTAAHEAAMEAGGATVAVMGGGLASPYPKENIPLFERVLASGGALVARVADDIPPTPWRFLHRNQILAAGTSATIVVQAGVRSGARSTAAAARRLGRPVFVVPHSPWDPRGDGCALDLVLGARAITQAAHVLDALNVGDVSDRAGAGKGSRVCERVEERARTRGSRSPGARSSRGDAIEARAPLLFPDLEREASGEPRLSREHQVGQRSELSPNERAVVHVLADLPMHVDEVCEKAALPLRQVAGLLLTLTLQAVVVEGPAGFYRRASH